jgi:peptidoglycan hydrolase-like protein with peptidoglycan-binding domain
MKKLGLVLAGVVLLGAGVAPAAQAATSPATTSVTAAADPTITYPARGRGAWSNRGMGGTVSSDGLLPGRYFRASALGLTKGPGYTGYRAVQDGQPVSIDDYAVHRAVLAIQTELRERGITSSDGKPLLLDGVWGAKVDSAIKSFQARTPGLTPDGVFGRLSSKALFTPLVEKAAAQADPLHRAELTRVMVGTVGWESNWDPAAVGGLTPNDVGLGQINGAAHPDMSVNDRLDPKKSLPFVAALIDSNLKAFGYRLDESVAAYNLGQGGARSWVRAGKPQYWPAGTTNDVHRYIDRILNPAP